MATGGAYAIFLNGPYGVGKTSTLDHVGNLLAAGNQPFSLLDVDWFHRSWPPATFDEDNTIIEARNMASVWSNYQTAGARQLVVSGVIASREDLDRYTEALAQPVRPIRLVANDSTIRSRLRSRYGSTRGTELDWHLQRYGELQDRMAATNIDEAVVDTDDRTPREVAQVVLGHFLIA